MIALYRAFGTRTLMNRLVILATALAALGACDSKQLCPTSAELRASLAAAQPGQVVALGACTVAGPFVVPAGVTLRGEGDESVITSTSGRAVELAATTDEPTVLEAVRVESSGCAAVVSLGSSGSGTEQVALRDVAVHVERGVGVALQGVSPNLTEVAIEGPNDPATLDATAPALPPYSCEGNRATHGLVLVDSPNASFTDVRSDGFAAFGALVLRSQLSWSGGGVDNNLGAGLEVVGGTASLRGLTLRGTSQGTGAVESYNGVFINDAEITTEDLVVMEGSTYGLFHAQGARATHVDLLVSQHGFAGVWAQGGGSLSLERATLEDNAFAGIASFDMPMVSVVSSVVANTRQATSVVGIRTVVAADGLHLVRSEGVIDDVQLLTNDRIGLLVDLGGASTASLAFTQVIVDGSGSELGALAQNGTVLPSWDADIQRRGATPTNDPRVANPLDIAGAVGPPCFPPLDGLDATGIVGLLGP